jgi:hypothetical protein
MMKSEKRYIIVQYIKLCWVMAGDGDGDGDG